MPPLLSLFSSLLISVEPERQASASELGPVQELASEQEQERLVSPPQQAWPPQQLPWPWVPLLSSGRRR